MKSELSIGSVTQTDTYHVRIHARLTDDISPVMNALTAAGANIRAVNTVLPRLEDVFLHLTGREIRDKAAASVPSARPHRWGARVSRTR